MGKTRLFKVYGQINVILWANFLYGQINVFLWAKKCPRYLCWLKFLKYPKYLFFGPNQLFFGPNILRILNLLLFGQNIKIDFFRIFFINHSHASWDGSLCKNLSSPRHSYIPPKILEKNFFRKKYVLGGFQGRRSRI